jgi:hypothetical protein
MPRTVRDIRWAGLVCVAVVVSIVFAIPAAASTHKAASTHTTTFGSSLDHSPANAGSTCAQDGVQGPATCTHVGSYYPGFSGHARSPVKGTITKIKVRAEGPATLKILIVKVRNVSSDHMSGQAKLVEKGPTIHPVGTGSVETFPVHLSVTKGEELAVNTKSNTAEYCSDGTPGQLLFDPTVGSSFSSSKGVDGCLMLVQAVVKTG